MLSASKTKAVDVPAPSLLRNWVRRAALLCLTLALLACAESAARRGVAEWFYHRQTVEGMRLAVRWNPQSASYRAGLADALESSTLEVDLREAVSLNEQATRLEPQGAQYWARLGAAYEADGRPADAARSYRTAVELFPRSPQMNWLLGNFLLRQDDTARALTAFRHVVAGSPAMRRATYQTAWGATEDSAQILAAMIPSRAEVLADYLQYLVDTRRLDAAREVWRKLLDGGFPLPPGGALRYVDAVLAEQRSADAIAAWQALAVREPNIYATEHRPQNSQGAHGAMIEPGGNRVTNGGFEFEVLGSGLDWRIAPADGVTTRVMAENAFAGARCLELDFAGTHNVEYSHVFELVPVEPDTGYLFTARVRTRQISSDQRPRFILRDARDERLLRVETPAVPVTSDWTELRMEFRTGPATHVIDLRLVRSQSRKFDGRISGTLWIDDVRMIALDATARVAARHAPARPSAREPTPGPATLRKSAR